MKLWEITGSRFEEIDKTVAILPVGSIERHGDHLPLGTDTIIPFEMALEVERRRKNVIILPPVYYGSCRGLKFLKGTFDIDSNILYKYVLEIILEAARNGIKLLVVLNGHGGNNIPLNMAAREAAYKSDINIIILNWWTDLAKEMRASLFINPGHAGEDETSIVLTLHPELVEMDKAFDKTVLTPTVRIYSRKISAKIYDKGLTGSASKADERKGKLWFETIVSDIIKIIDETLKYLREMDEG